MMLNRYAQLFAGAPPPQGSSLGAPSMPHPPPGAVPNGGELAQQWYRQHTGYLPGSSMAGGAQAPGAPPLQGFPNPMLQSPGALAPPHAGMMPPTAQAQPQGYDFGQRFGLMQQAMRGAQSQGMAARGRVGGS